MLFTKVQNSKILIVDEAPTTNDLLRQAPMSGTNGEELTRMLHEAGILISECNICCVSTRQRVNNDTKNMFKTKTPKEWIPDGILMRDLENLWKYIEQIQPNLIIALGDLSTWAVTNQRSVSKWRGSICTSEPPLPSIKQSRAFKVIPTFSPMQVMRMYPWRHIAVQDFRRCANEAAFPEDRVPDYLFHVRPTFAEAHDFLDNILSECEKRETLISSDIETISKQISCAGWGLDQKEAMCIPILTKDNPDGYWSEKEELSLVSKQRKVLLHPNARPFGQNYLYDTQYFIRFWGARPAITTDTMIAWHTLYPGEKKSLDYIASMLCEHYCYWKDENKDYHKYPLDEEQYWRYNCKDIVYTYECQEKVEKLIDHHNLREQYQFQLDMHKPVLDMMLRGVRIDVAYKKQLGMELWDLTSVYDERFNSILDPKAISPKAKAPWYNSPIQLQKLFYEQMKLPKQRRRSKGVMRVTTDDKALDALKIAEPALKKLFTMLQEYRSINVFNKNFVQTPLEDKRMHCSFAIAGPETFRFASSEDPFGYGTNLQNIPAGTEK